jgi:hypothetical protein
MMGGGGRGCTLGGLALELKFLAPRGVRDGLGAYLMMSAIVR